MPVIDEDRRLLKRAARAAWKADLSSVDVAPPSGTVGDWTISAHPRDDGRISVYAESEGWDLVGFCAFAADDLVLTEIILKPAGDPPANGLTGTVLRGIPVAAIVAEARRQVIAAPALFAAIPPEVGLMSPDALVRIKELAARLDTRALHRGGRRGFPDDFYRGIASEYLELQSAGMGRGILVEIARLATERLGRHVTRENARDWVRRATNLQFLSPGIPGKAGRIPGPKLFASTETTP